MANEIHLWDALALGDVGDGGPDARPAVVAVVGGGGKTTLVYRLALDAAALGRCSVVTGTARFTRLEPMPPLIQAPPDEAPGHLSATWDGDPEASRCLVLAGNGEQPAGRLDPLAPEIIDRLSVMPGLGLIAIEADGSKMRPFKAPAEHEPIIPDSATHIVAVVGVDALDAPLDEQHVHRPERVREILGHDRIRDVHEGVMCDAAMVAAILAHPLGGRKGAGDRPFTVVVNKADIDLDGAVRLARAVRDAGVERVVITTLWDEANPVREVLT